MRALLESGADVNAEHTAALWMAAGAGHIETVRLLLERGADIHAYDDLALFQAVWYADILPAMNGGGSGWLSH